MWKLTLLFFWTSLGWAAPGDAISNGHYAFKQVRTVYSSTNVTTSAWVQLVASTGSHTSVLEVFDSSGQTLEIGTGAAGSETVLFIIPPGGNGPVLVTIPGGTRVAIKALSGTANAGEGDLNFYD